MLEPFPIYSETAFLYCF